MRMWWMALALTSACAGQSEYVVAARPHCEVPVVAAVPSQPRTEPPERGVGIIVIEGHHLGRPTEVIGIIDVHAAMGGEAAALDEMRLRASILGADAVLGAEFHHGEENETHLSGMAVRFVQIEVE